MSYRVAASALALLLGASCVPNIAFAQYFDDNGQPPPPPGYRRPPPPGYPPPPGDFYGRPPPPPPRFGRGCDPDEAEDQARDMGFRRAHVVDVSPRRVVVEGMTRYGPDRVLFANVRGCPVIGR